MTAQTSGSTAQDPGAPPPPDVRLALKSAGSHFLSLVELGVLKTFIDHKVFDAIPDEGDISLDELAEAVRGEAALLERFSNYLVAAGVLGRSDESGRIHHTDRSRGLRGDGIAAMFIVHVYTFLLGPLASWPAYFEKHGLAEPKSADAIPLGLATGHPDLGLYEVLDAEPKLARLFNKAQILSAGIYPLKGLYDFGWIEPKLKAASSSSRDAQRPAIVDIGGSTGLALRQILADYPFVPASRCAVLDLPKTVAEATDPQGLRMVGGSMLEPLPVSIRGAVVYQFRRVLSDFLDHDIVLALKNTRDACAPDSRVLIVEELLHPQRSTFFLAQDISVMNFGGKRRSQAMFTKLAEEAGFKVNAVFENDGMEVGVLELVVM